MYIKDTLATLALTAGVASAAALPDQGASSDAATCKVTDLKHYFAFGASFTQTLFNENSTQPDCSRPMGNPYPPSTFTGGTNYVGFLTTKYNSSTVYNYDFARGGATTSRSVVNTGKDSTTFEEQVHWHFLPKYAPTADNRIWTSDDAYFSFHFGINDITIPITSAKSPSQIPDRMKRVPEILDRYFTYVEDLYQAGARRFMMINVPPQDRTPMFASLNETLRAAERDYIIEFNAQLLNRTRTFQASHAGAAAAYYDINAFMSAVLDNPTAYGFPDATCIDPKGQRCIWWNNFHPGEKFDDQWSARMKHAMDAVGYNGSKPVGGYFK